VSNGEIVPAENQHPRLLDEDKELPSPECNPYVVYLARLDSDESRRTMRSCLDRIAAIAANLKGSPPAGLGARFTWHLLRHQHTAALRAEIHKQTSARSGQPWSPNQINKHLVALRGVLKQAWKLEQMTTDAYMRASSIDAAKGSREPVGRSVAAEEFAKLLGICLEEGSASGTRDAAIFAVLHSTGLRRAEVAKIARADYDAGAGSIRVIGKGNKQRTVYVHEDATKYVSRWLRISEHIRGPLFCPIDRHGHLSDRVMTPRAIAHVVSKRRLQAGLAKLSPHDFRRTFAGDLLDSGADLVQVKGLLGHTSADVTARYDRRPERARKAAVGRLRLPSPDAIRSQEPLPRDTKNEA
jgi:site-specific recombinase XerD